MNRDSLLKLGVVIGSVSVAVYGSKLAYDTYKLYRRASETTGTQQDYEKGYINDFIRKISRTSK